MSEQKTGHIIDTARTFTITAEEVKKVAQYYISMIIDNERVPRFGMVCRLTASELRRKYPMDMINRMGNIRFVGYVTRVIRESFLWQ